MTAAQECQRCFHPVGVTTPFHELALANGYEQVIPQEDQTQATITLQESQNDDPTNAPRQRLIRRLEDTNIPNEGTITTCGHAFHNSCVATSLKSFRYLPGQILCPSMRCRELLLPPVRKKSSSQSHAETSSGSETQTTSRNPQAPYSFRDVSGGGSRLHLSQRVSLPASTFGSLPPQVIQMVNTQLARLGITIDDDQPREDQSSSTRTKIFVTRREGIIIVSIVIIPTLQPTNEPGFTFNPTQRANVARNQDLLSYLRMLMTPQFASQHTHREGPGRIVPSGLTPITLNNRMFTPTDLVRSPSTFAGPQSRVVKIEELEDDEVTPPHNLGGGQISYLYGKKVTLISPRPFANLSPGDLPSVGGLPSIAAASSSSTGSMLEEQQHAESDDDSDLWESSKLQNGPPR